MPNRIVTSTLLALVLVAGAQRAHAQDNDGDGLTNVEETALTATDPNDPDSDDDLLRDDYEVGLPADPTNTDGDGLIDALDPDSDDDTISDRDESGCEALCTLGRDTDGDGRPDFRDDDSDGDGVPDAEEAGDADLDTPAVDSDGDGIEDYRDDDSDDDGVPDGTDLCRTVADPEQADFDADAVGDACDDSDEDGVPDATDDCPVDADAEQTDTDGDGAGDVCDADDDGDGVADAGDDCPAVANPAQQDLDADGACDLLVFGDGQVGVFRGDGAGGWTKTLQFATPGNGAKTFAAFRAGADIDHNGYPDFAVVQDEGGGFNSANRTRVFREASVATQRTLRVTAPGPGRAWRAGQVRAVEWLSARPPGTAAGSVAIELSLDGPGGPWQPLAAGLPDNGHAQVTAPVAVASQHAWVRVRVSAPASELLAIAGPLLLLD